MNVLKCGESKQHTRKGVQIKRLCFETYLHIRIKHFKLTFLTLRLPTFDDVNNVMVLADEGGVDGALDAQLPFHGLGVADQEGVRLADFVNEQMLVLNGAERKWVFHALRVLNTEVFGVTLIM